MTAGTTWLAICDEIGNFDNFDPDIEAQNKGKKTLGIGMVIARKEDWKQILEERLCIPNDTQPAEDWKQALSGAHDGSRSIKDILENPIQNLNQINNNKKSGNFHIKDLGNNRQQFLYGKLSELSQSDNPLGKELGTVFQWLAEHPKIIKVGLLGSPHEIRKSICGDTIDQQYALGQIMGYMAAFLAPYFSSNDKLIFISPSRSELAEGAEIFEKIGANPQKLNKNGRTEADQRPVINGFKERFQTQNQTLLNYNPYIQMASCDIFTYQGHPYKHLTKSLDALADVCAALFNGIQQSRNAIQPEPEKWQNVIPIYLPQQ